MWEAEGGNGKDGGRSRQGMAGRTKRSMEKEQEDECGLEEKSSKDSKKNKIADALLMKRIYVGECGFCI